MRFWRWLRNSDKIEALTKERNSLKDELTKVRIDKEVYQISFNDWVEKERYAYWEMLKARKERDDLAKAVGKHGRELQKIREQRLVEVRTHAAVVQSLRGPVCPEKSQTN